MTLAFRCFLSLVLLVLSAWLFDFCRDLRRLYFRDYTYSAQEAQDLARHAEVLYAHGVQAESMLNRTGAMDLYSRATARDPLHMSAWLRLADAAAAAGDTARGRRIVEFCNAHIGPVLRWKWPHTLLAHGLGMENIFAANINFLVARNTKLNDSLALLDTHCQGDPQQALLLLQPDNHSAYLTWAMRWKNGAAARAAWQSLSDSGRADHNLLSEYVHFLVAQNQIVDAADVWRQATGTIGLTNGGFEAGITGKGFDWRTTRDRDGRWDIRQDAAAGRNGGGALQIRFDGRDNIVFHHVHKVAPVTPETPSRLTFWWRDAGLTTDQAPFVEVYSYDAKGLAVRSQPLRGADQWRQAFIDFTPPPNCNAVGIRIRRLASQRFDNKIRGSIWLDDFEMEKF